MAPMGTGAATGCRVPLQAMVDAQCREAVVKKKQSWRRISHIETKTDTVRDEEWACLVLRLQQM